MHVRTWQQAYAGIVPEDFLASMAVAKSTAEWSAAIARGTPQMLVARVDTGIVGWIAFGPCRDAGAPADAAEVWAFYVLPSHWSSGVGRRLWADACERLCQQVFRTVSLWLLAENARAIRFYRAAGLSADPASMKSFELGGKMLQEIRYSNETAQLARYAADRTAPAGPSP